MNPAQYQSILSRITASPEYNSLDQATQQQVLKEARDEFVQANPQNENSANYVTQQINQKHLRATGEGRYIPDVNEFQLEKLLPWQSQGWEAKSQEEKEEELDAFRTEIPNLASQDKINEEDRGFYLNAVTDQVTRQVRGGDTGWFVDKGARVFEGFAAGLVSFAGQDELAQEIRNYVADNPAYDDDFAAKLATGAGDLGASTTVFLGGTLLSGGNPGVGTAALFAGTATRKYQDAYNQALDLGLTEDQAADAGWAATPGAAIEIVGDRLIAGRFLPKSVRDSLKSARTTKDKAKLIGEIMKDEGLRKGAMRVARDAFGEGVSEALGDYTSGYGAYLSTNYKDFVPDKDSLIDSFTIGAVLGGGVATVSEGSQVRFEKEGGKKALTTKNQRLVKDAVSNVEALDSASLYTKSERETQIFDLLREGKYKEAYSLSKTPLEEGEVDGEQALLLPEPAGKKDAPQQEVSTEEENNIIFDEESNPLLPFNTTENPEAQALSDTLTGADPEIRNAQLNEQIPERAQFQSDLEALGAEGRNVTPEQAQTVSGLIDIVATKWLAADPSRKASDFYSRFDIKSPDTLRAFNFVADKFVAKVKDPKRNRQIGQAAAFNTQDKTVVATSKKAEVPSLVSGVISALRQSGIMEDVIGQDGLATIQKELQIAELNEQGDARLAEGVLDWMRRAEPQNEASSAVFNNLKTWIKDLYQGVRNYFSQFLPSRFQPSKELDQELANLFDFTPFDSTTETFGREVTSSDLDVDANSDLQQSKAATQAARGQVRQSTKGKPVTPRNESSLNQTEQEADAALKSAMKSSKEAKGDLFSLNDSPRQKSYPSSVPLMNEITAGNMNGKSLLDAIKKTEPGQTLVNLVGKNNIIFDLIEKVDVKPDFKSHYNRENNTLYLSTANPETIAHELTHAILSGAIDNAPDFRRAIDELILESQTPFGGMSRTSQSLLQIAKAEYAKADTNLDLSQWFAENVNDVEEIYSRRNNFRVPPRSDSRIAYAMSGAHEFVAAALTDSNFRKMLNSQVKAEEKSIWEKFLDAVKNLFGIKKQSPGKIGQLERIITEAIDSGVIVENITHPMQTSFIIGANRSLNQLEESDPVNEEKKIEQFFKRFRAIRNGTINDKSDSNTGTIMRLIKRINPQDIMAMPDEGINDFSDLVDNIYEARTSSVPDPALRKDSDEVLDALNKYIYAIDQFKIAEMKSEVDGLVDFSKFDGDQTNRAEIEKFINDNLIKSELDTDGSSGSSERYSEKQEAWREKFELGRQELQSRYSTAEDWLEDFEKINGSKIKSDSLKGFLLQHFDYLHTLADVDTLEGKDLYTHFYAINNIIDGRIAYAPETTVRYMQALKDGEVDFSDIENKFRDPMLYKNKFIMNLDQVARSTELMQTQLDRWSSFEEARTFLQKDLMGDLLDSIVREAENNRAKAEDKYIETRKNLEKILDREVNGEDRIVMAITSRLIQYEIGQDPNQAIIQNIQNERASHENVFDEGDNENQELHRDTIVPLFDSLIEGIEDSDTPMEDFMSGIEDRMGQGSFGLGNVRRQLLYKMMDIVNEFRLDQEIVSEAFHKKPFRAWANYMPRQTIPTEATKADGETSPVDLAAEIEEFDSNQYQSMSMVGIPSQLQSRKMVLGKRRYYANNIESIFDRSIRLAAMTSSTTADRFVLKERLKKGNPVFNTIKGTHRSDRRVRELEGWAKELVYNAMFNGESIGALNGALKLLNEAYARVALSGVHQGITQTLSGFMDYQWRTGNLTGAMQGLSFYAQNRTKMNTWFDSNAKWIANRSLLGEVELDRKKNPIVDENSIRAIPFVKGIEKFHKGAGKIITFSLRTGDDFTAKSLTIAEYTRLLGQKNPTVKDVTDVDWDTVDGKLLTQAIINVERNINASNKVLRGKLFTDRNAHVSAIRNLLFAFSSHVMTLSAQLNLAARDIIELSKLDATEGQITPKLKTIGAILGQTMTFSVGRYVINGGLALGMVKLLQSLYDDDEGKIAELELDVVEARKTGDPVAIVDAENELAMAESVRKQIEKFKSRSWSSTSFFKSVVREEAGILHFVMQGPQIPQKIFAMIPDKLGREIMNQEKEAQVTELKAQIKEAKEGKRFGEAAKLSEQLVAIEAMEYIPWEYQNFSNLGMGGITGTTLETMYSTLNELSSSALGLREANYNDYILGAQSGGIGQADILRFFRQVDKIEDDLYKKQLSFEGEKVPAAHQKAVEQREKKREALIKKLTK